MRLPGILRNDSDHPVQRVESSCNCLTSISDTLDFIVLEDATITRRWQIKREEEEEKGTNKLPVFIYIKNAKENKREEKMRMQQTKTRFMIR